VNIEMNILAVRDGRERQKTKETQTKI